MARLYTKPSYANYIHKNKTWFAGETVDKGSYVCRHCNTNTAVVQGEVLPLCRTCYGRRFTRL